MLHIFVAIIVPILVGLADQTTIGTGTREMISTGLIVGREWASLRVVGLQVFSLASRPAGVEVDAVASGDGGKVSQTQPFPPYRLEPDPILVSIFVAIFVSLIIVMIVVRSCLRNRQGSRQG